MAHLNHQIAHAYWNNGYATEEAWVIVRTAKNLAGTKVLSEAFVKNKTSARVLQNLGLKNIGQIKRHIPQRVGM